MKRTILTITLASGLLLLFRCGAEKSGTAPSATTSASPSVATTATEAPADPVALAAKGKDLFGQNCATCHGASGKGDGPGAAALNPKPRNFTDLAYMDKLKDIDIRNTIKYGGSIKGMPQMPNNPQYDEAQLAQLVAFVRTFSHPK